MTGDPTTRTKPAVPWRRRLASVGIGLLVSGAVLIGADYFFPVPLDRFRDRSPLVLDRDDRLLRGFLSRDDKWRLGVAPSQVDTRYLRILKAYEDKRFDHHPGVDALAVARAVGQLLRHGEVISGASTLTMQAARLLEPGSRGLAAKLHQMVRAVQLEVHFSKDEILAIYLTLAPFGGNLEGVRAASLAYYGKEPTALTLGEAALLVALPQAPERQRPDRFRPRAKAGRDKVLDRLRAAGIIDGTQHAEARQETVPGRRQAFPFLAPRLARRLVQRYRDETLIRTGLDRDLQTVLEEQARRAASGFDDGASMAMVVVENDTRRVRAYLGGHDYGAPAGHVDLAAAIRSPGSTLKPFIYGLAFDDLLLHPDSLIEDRRMAFGSYAPRNFDRGFQGTVTARMALQQSLNIPAVALLDQIGPHRLYAGLRQAGATLTLPSDAVEASLPVALGGVGISLRDLTMLYAGLANGGKVRPLSIMRNGPGVRSPRLFADMAAWYVTDILENAPLPDGWGQARNIVRDRRIAFKTGTSAAFQDAWAIGYSRRYTVGVWVGRADGTPRPGAIGRNAAAPLMLQAFSVLPAEAEERHLPPEDVITVRNNKELPLALRRFVVRDRTRMPSEGTPLRILYPPEGATVLFSSVQERLTFNAEGGRGPLSWIVNGRVLPRDNAAERYGEWTVDGAGFVTVSVVDAEGHSDRSTFRVVR